MMPDCLLSAPRHYEHKSQRQAIKSRVQVANKRDWITIPGLYYCHYHGVVYRMTYGKRKSKEVTGMVIVHVLDHAPRGVKPGQRITYKELEAKVKAKSRQ